MTNHNSPLARWTARTEARETSADIADHAPEKRKFISPLNLFARRQTILPIVTEAVSIEETEDGLDVAEVAASEAEAEDDFEAIEDALQEELNREIDAEAESEVVAVADDPEAMQIVEIEDDAEDAVADAAADIEFEIADEAEMPTPIILSRRVETPVAPSATPEPAVPEQAAETRPSEAALKAAAEVAAVGVRRGSSRVKTTFLGFERSDGRIEDVFDKAREAAATVNVMYPVGWMVIVDGPGCGNSFTLQTGVSQIGRGEDQAIQLDFGDNGISRSNHAAIAYDDEDRKFYLGHGGKSNIVRLNGKPVLSTETLGDGDKIRIGETTLVFVAFCGPGFQWTAEK